MPGFVKELSKHKFTAMTGVNTLFNGLLNTPGFDQLNFDAFRLALGGGMAVQKNTADRWKKVTGVTLLEAYGLTETSAVIAVNYPGHHRLGTVGPILPNVEAKIAEELIAAQGDPVDLGGYFMPDTESSRQSGPPCSQSS